MGKSFNKNVNYTSMRSVKNNRDSNKTSKRNRQRCIRASNNNQIAVDDISKPNNWRQVEPKSFTYEKHTKLKDWSHSIPYGKYQKIGKLGNYSISNEITEKEFALNNPNLGLDGIPNKNPIKIDQQSVGYWDKSKGSTLDRINTILETNEKYNILDKDINNNYNKYNDIKYTFTSNNYLKACKKQIVRRGSNSIFKGHNRDNN